MYKHLLVPTPGLAKWNLLKPLEPDTLSEVKCFIPHRRRLYAILNDRKVIACGKNSKGWLGLGHKEKVDTFEEIITLRGKLVKEIVCGWGHLMVLTEDGQVWGWGWNCSGQLGLGDIKDRLVPQLIFDKDIVSIKSGWAHSLALTKHGKVYAWGHNWDGRVGNGTKVHQLTPFQIKSLNSEVIEHIELGARHSIAVSREGKIYGWGYNGCYQLASGNKENQLSPVEGNVDNQAIQIVACSLYSTIFLTRGGQLYQSDMNSVTPRLIQVNNQIPFKQIYCVPFENLFLAFNESEQLFHWVDATYNEKFDRELCEPIKTSLSLTEIISQHSTSEGFPVLLYHQICN